MTNRYSRTGTALADGISGTRVMQPANNAVIQAPALPRLFRSNCSADKKAPLEIRRPFLPEPFMRPQASCVFGLMAVGVFWLAVEMDNSALQASKSSCSIKP